MFILEELKYMNLDRLLEIQSQVLMEIKKKKEAEEQLNMKVEKLEQVVERLKAKYEGKYIQLLNDYANRKHLSEKANIYDIQLQNGKILMVLSNMNTNSYKAMDICELSNVDEFEENTVVLCEAMLIEPRDLEQLYIEEKKLEDLEIEHGNCKDRIKKLQAKCSHRFKFLELDNEDEECGPTHVFECVECKMRTYKEHSEVKYPSRK